jgi:hypothetical protein
MRRIGSRARIARSRQNTTGLGAAGDIVFSPPFSEQVQRGLFGAVCRTRLAELGSQNLARTNRARLCQRRRPPTSPNPWGIQMRIICLACTVTLLSTALLGRADRASAEVSDAVRQACTPDAMRLCSDVIPDVAKITACMKRKSAQISEPCRVAMRGERGHRHGHYRGHYHHHHH